MGVVHVVIGRSGGSRAPSIGGRAHERELNVEHWAKITAGGRSTRIRPIRMTHGHMDQSCLPGRWPCGAPMRDSSSRRCRAPQRRRPARAGRQPAPPSAHTCACGSTAGSSWRWPAGEMPGKQGARMWPNTGSWCFRAVLRKGSLRTERMMWEQSFLDIAPTQDS